MKIRLFFLSVVLLLSASVYYALGGWQALAIQHWIKNTESELSAQVKKQITREQLIDWLHHKAETMPESPEAWSVMAEYALLLQDYPQAVRWSEKALQAAPDNPYAMLQYIQIAFPVEGGRFTEQSRTVLQRLAILEPTHLSVLNFLAIDAFAEGRYDVAKRIWQQLLQDLPPDSDILPTLYKALQEVDVRLLQAVPTDKRIRLQLNHLAAIKQRRLATDYVFISVRQPGVNMPLLVKKLRLSELSDSLVLSSADAMSQGSTLESVSEVTVSLKITASPDPLKPDANTETFVSPLIDTAPGETLLSLDLS